METRDDARNALADLVYNGPGGHYWPVRGDRCCLECREFWRGDPADLDDDDIPDPCLGMLPFVRFACCGHGLTSRAYVMLEGVAGQGLETTVTLRGAMARAYFLMVKSLD